MPPDVVSELKSDSESIIITEDILTKHSIFLGATGSGKTTTLNVLLRDIIGYKSDSETQKPGLLILDYKNDSTIDKVRKWAKEVWRGSDIVDYSADGKFYYNPFANFSTFEDVGIASDIIISMNPQRDPYNNYWECSLAKRVKLTLESIILLQEKLTFETFAERFQLLMSGDITPWVHAVVSIVDSITGLLKLAHREKKPEYEKFLKISKGIQLQLKEWKLLDSRTKSIEISTMSNLASSFNSANVVQFMWGGKGKKLLDMESIISKGKIVVATLPGTTDIGLAGIIGKMLKADFYLMIQNRALPANARLCGAIMDEFQLCATSGMGLSSDPFNLQTIRSKRAFVIAATQELISLDCSFGYDYRELLMTNFNNVFIFHSNEIEVQELCDRMLEDYKGPSHQIGFLAPIVPRDEFKAFSVENLETGYAFVKLANGFRTSAPVKMERLFVDIEPKKTGKTTADSLTKCLETIKMYRDSQRVTAMMKKYEDFP